MKYAWSIGLTIVLMASAAAGQTIVEDGKSDYVIVLAKDPLPANKRAAEELNTHLRQMSGVELPIQDDATEPPARAILIGPSRFIDPPKELGNDGFLLRTNGEQLIIAGPGPRGSMYGVSDVLEKLGLRWFAPKVTFVPKKATVELPALDEQQTPAFEYRETYFVEAWDQDWSARNRLIGHSHRLDESTGGNIRFADFVHSFDRLIPPALYSEHPEYFPLIKGKRTDGYVQRCLTNADVLKLAVEGVKKSFAADPSAVLCSVSQNDCYKFCECDECNKIVAQYGGVQSGVYLWFVNKVAEQIEKELGPEKLIETLAYQFTEQPPSGIKPRHNVRVRLCPIAVCQAHPYAKDDYEPSKAFVANLAGWAKVTDTLYIWAYCTDFAHYLMPFPDFAEFPADIRMYRDNGVRGVFFQGAYGGNGGGSDAELRCWVMSKLLWNPDLDSDKLVTEWMNGVYGKAAAPMRKWFDLLHAEAARPQNHFTCFQDITPGFLPDELLLKALTLFEEADKLAGDDATARRYINKQRLDVRYVQLTRHPASADEIKKFAADCRAVGISLVAESKGLEQWERERLAGAKP